MESLKRLDTGGRGTMSKLHVWANLRTPSQDSRRYPVLCWGYRTILRLRFSYGSDNVVLMRLERWLEKHGLMEVSF